MKSFWDKHAWKVVAAVLFAIVLLASVRIARAAGTSATLTWSHPTSYVDGTTLALADIKETVITWRRPGIPTIVGSVRVAAPATTTVVTGLTCGNFQFTAATVIKTNASSVETAPILYSTGVGCQPNPPTGLEAN